MTITINVLTRHSIEVTKDRYGNIHCVYVLQDLNSDKEFVWMTTSKTRLEKGEKYQIVCEVHINKNGNINECVSKVKILKIL